MTKKRKPPFVAFKATIGDGDVRPFLTLEPVGEGEDGIAIKAHTARVGRARAEHHQDPSCLDVLGRETDFGKHPLAK